MQAPAPSKELLRRVQAGFVLQGESLRAWCRKNELSPSAARSALLGTWDGPTGREWRQRLCTAARIDRVRAA